MREAPRRRTAQTAHLRITQSWRPATSAGHLVSATFPPTQSQWGPFGCRLGAWGLIRWLEGVPGNQAKQQQRFGPGW